MVCPKCGEKAAYEAQEKCAACRQVFSTWKPGGGAAVAQAPVSAAAPSGASPDPPRRLDLRWMVAALLLLSVGYVARLALEAAPEMTMWLSPFAAGGRIKNPCFLEGEVVDIYRLTPVEGARIAFDPKFASVTDAAGKFSVRVKADQAYAPHFVHNDYRSLHLDGFSRDWRQATLQQRQAAVRVAETYAAEQNSQVLRTIEYRCKRGEARTFNYALIPVNLTDEERVRFLATP